MYPVDGQDSAGQYLWWIILPWADLQAESVVMDDPASYQLIERITGWELEPKQAMISYVCGFHVELTPLILFSGLDHLFILASVSEPKK